LGVGSRHSTHTSSSEDHIGWTYAGRLKQNANGRFLIVSHIDNDKIRIISAREMTADVKHYVVDKADVISLQLKKRVKSVFNNKNMM
jgi:hypothetical protein